MNKKCIRCLGALNAATRLKIMRRLRGKPQRAWEIEKFFNLTQPTISYHLKVLKKTGMLKAQKSGREIYYSLNKKYLCRNCVISKI